MNTINNRYRILKFIKQNKFASSYLVYDLNLQSKMRLNIINYEKVPKSLIKYYVEEFINWTNIDNMKINKVYDFGIINLIDNKKINDVKYFYTNEYYENMKEFRDIINKIDREEKILDVFIEICEAIDYLHLRGFLYNELNLKNICVVDDSIRLKDVPTIKLDKVIMCDNEDLHLCKQELKNSDKIVYSDICSLGIILFYLCVSSYTNFTSDVFKNDNVKIKPVLSENFINKIEVIIKKCVDKKNGYNSVRDIIKDINSTLEKNYQLRDVTEIKKLNLNFKLVGRNEETKLIMNEYNSILSDNSEDKIVLVHGDPGIGKTSFLKDLTNMLTYRKANIYTSFSSNNREAQPFKEILAQIIAESDPEILEKYEEDLINFIPEIKYRRNLMPPEKEDASKEKLKLLNRINGFINDFTKYKPIVVIVEDIHLSDDFSIQLLKSFCERKIKNKSILMIVTYCDGKHILNKNTLEFIENIKFKGNVTNLRLKGLDEDETGEMIKRVLGMHEAPERFAEMIYSKSYGNPLFIQELMKDFYYKGIIYINSETGKWSTNYCYNEFPIPSDINQILLNQIKGIDEISYNILSVVAVFLNSVSIQDIEFMTQYSNKCIKKRIKVMLEKGLLCRKIGDLGFVYDFYNRLLKDLIYDKIEEKDRKEKHKMAAEFVEKQYIQGHEQYMEELIYQLKKANENEKVVKYCILNAKTMKKFNNHIEAIKNFKCAIEVLEESSLEEKKLEIIKNIVELYDQIGEFNKAIQYLKELELTAKKLNNLNYEVYSLNKRASIYCDTNNLDKLERCIGKVSKIIDKDKDLKGYLEYRLILARLFNLKEDYEEAEKICRESIEICTEKYTTYKGYFYNLMSYIYIMKSEPNKAERVLRNSIEIFRKIGDNLGLVKALNNMGAVYGDFYQNRNKAYEYYMEILGICKEHSLVTSAIMVNNNLAEGYYYEQNYKDALKYFKEVEEKSKRYDLETSLFYSYVFLCKIHIRIGDYDKAVYYYKLCNKELEAYVIGGTDILEYYKASAEMHLEVGDFETAREFIIKALSSDDKNESILRISNEFLLNYIEIYYSQGSEVNKILENIDRILLKINDINIRIALLCKLDWLLYHRGLYIEGRRVLKVIEGLSRNKRNLNYLKLYITYLQAIYYEEDKIKLLNNALNLAKQYSNKAIESEIYKEIGKYYFYKQDYFNAFVYYFECCEVIIEMIKTLPLEYKKTFMDFYNIHEMINRLKSIKEYYYGNKDNLNKEILDINAEKINSVLNFINCKDIMDNKHFLKSVKGFYSSLFHNEIHDIKDVLTNITCDEINNLNIILQYMLYITMGTNAYIIEEQENNFEQIIYIGTNKPLDKEDYYIINECKDKKDIILISNIENFKDASLNSIKNIKACVCIPIILISKGRYGIKNNRNNDPYNDVNIIAYVYIRSERALNNLSIKTLRKCKQLNGLIGLILQKYKLNKIAAYDKLTGVLTRKYLEEGIERNLDVAVENNGIFSMIMFDLDHFKNINDKFGHQTGDKVLKEICSIVKSNIRSTDICGRYGGEEFIIILKNSNVKDANNVAEKLRKKVEEAKILGDKAKVTVSMGIVGYPTHGQWKEDLIEKVDQALYMAKENGRNQCVVWYENTSSRVKITNKLTGIITGNEVQNNRNVLVMVELIELLNKNLEFTEKVYRALGRIIEITESQYGILIELENEKIKRTFSRKAFEEKWVNIEKYNKYIVQTVIEKKHGVYTIDWNNIMLKDPITGSPDWQSLIVVPLIKNDIIKGVLYLSTSIREKEFDFEDFNFVDTLAKIISNML